MRKGLAVYGVALALVAGIATAIVMQLRSAREQDFIRRWACYRDFDSAEKSQFRSLTEVQRHALDDRRCVEAEVLLDKLANVRGDLSVNLCVPGKNCRFIPMVRTCRAAPRQAVPRGMDCSRAAGRRYPTLKHLSRTGAPSNEWVSTAQVYTAEECMRIRKQAIEWFQRAYLDDPTNNDNDVALRRLEASYCIQSDGTPRALDDLLARMQ